MRRVLATFEYKARWWLERASEAGNLTNAKGNPVSPEAEEGLSAYAQRQAQLQRDIAKSFEDKWAPLREEGITIDQLKAMRLTRRDRAKLPDERAQLAEVVEEDEIEEGAIAELEDGCLDDWEERLGALSIS